MLNWANLDPARTERAVAGLIQASTKGAAAPVDGAGGDDAQDLRQQHSDGTLTIFEIKSFSRRLTPGQRKQIEKSYRNAVEQHRPKTWVLVLPLEHTPSELRWFEDLRPARGRGPRKVWRGRTWLDWQMSQHPEWRFYVEGAASELLQRAGQHQLERSAMATGADLFARQESLSKLGDGLSPYWRWRRNEGPDGVVAKTLEARLADSAIKDPITIDTLFSFPDADRAGDLVKTRFLHTMAYGGAVEIPGRFVEGFDVVTASEATGQLLDTGPRQVGRLVIQSIPDTTGLPVTATLEAQLPSGERAEISITFVGRVGGERGQTMRGHDQARVLGVELLVPHDNGDDDGHRLDVTSNFVGKSAHDATPALRWLAMNEGGAALTIRAGPLVLATTPAGPAAEEPVHLKRYRYAAALEAIQNHTGRLFHLPAEVSDDAARPVLQAGRALAGGHASLSYTGIEHTITSEEDRQAALAFPEESGVLTGLEWSVTLQGEDVQIDGLAAYGARVTLDNREELARGDATSAVLVCQDDETLRLIKMPETLPDGWYQAAHLGECDEACRHADPADASDG